MDALESKWGAFAMPREFYLPKEIRGTPPTLTPEGTDLAIWTWTGTEGKAAGKLYAIVFQGKAAKPLWYHTFSSEAGRDAYIERTVKTRKDVIQRAQARKELQQQFQHTFKVGDILYASWGYDQTNIDFFQVVGTTEKTVSVREIDSKTVGGSQGTDYVMPVPDHFTGPVISRRPNPQGSLAIKSFIYAYSWDGKPKHQTAAGYGH